MNRKGALLISIFCLFAVCGILAYFFYELRDIYDRGDEGRSPKKIVRQINFENRDELSEDRKTPANSSEKFAILSKSFMVVDVCSSR